jgi:hypothetical protein
MTHMGYDTGILVFGDMLCFGIGVVGWGVQHRLGILIWLGRSYASLHFLFGWCMEPEYDTLSNDYYILNISRIKLRALHWLPRNLGTDAMAPLSISACRD